MKIVRFIFIITIVLGLLINLIPTIDYYLRIYPHLRESLLDKDSYLLYSIGGAAGFVDNMSSKPVIRFEPIKGSLRIHTINETCLRYSVNLDFHIIRNSQSIKNNIVGSSGVCSDSPLFQLFLPRERYSVNISESVVSLNKVAQIDPIFARTSFYLYPVIYLADLTFGEEVDKRFLYLRYIELEEGRILLGIYFSIGSAEVLDTDRLLIQMLFSTSPYLVSVTSNLELSSDTTIYIQLIDTNVRVANDIIKRLILDMSFSFFPINVALIAIGFIGLILIQRRIIR